MVKLFSKTVKKEYFQEFITPMVFSMIFLIGLTIFHEIGHLFGLLICGVQIKHFFVPFWLEPITFIPLFKVHDNVNLWVWGWSLDNMSLDLISVLFHVIIVPLIFEILYIRKTRLPYKILIPFSLIFKWNDFWLVFESIRTFVFVQWEIVL